MTCWLLWCFRFPHLAPFWFNGNVWWAARLRIDEDGRHQSSVPFPFHPSSWWNLETLRPETLSFNYLSFWSLNNRSLENHIWPYPSYSPANTSCFFKMISLLIAFLDSSLSSWRFRVLETVLHLHRWAWKSHFSQRLLSYRHTPFWVKPICAEGYYIVTNDNWLLD